MKPTTTNHGSQLPETGVTADMTDAEQAKQNAGIISVQAAPPPKYPVDEATKADLAKRFTYHAPKTDQPQRYTTLRSFGGTLARMIAENTPKSREQSLALTHLEEALFWANASIARNE